MSFRPVPKSVTSNDPERRNGPYFALFLPNLVISGEYCVNVVDKAITTDNLRLLCLVVNVCRGTAILDFQNLNFLTFVTVKRVELRDVPNFVEIAPTAAELC